MSVTRADVEAAESPKDLYDLAIALCDERDSAPTSDRFADGVTEACRLIRAVMERSMFSPNPLTLEQLVFAMMLEMQNAGFPDAAREMRRE